MDAQQKQDEAHFRQVERALLYADDAARRILGIADELSRDGCDPGLVDALRSGSESIREEHRTMIKRVYFRAPQADDARQELLPGDQSERLAS